MSLPVPVLSSCQSENVTRMRRHSHPPMEPGCQMSTLAKMSSLWQDHIHNKAFIYIFFNHFFSLYRYLWTFFVYFHTCFSPQWQCATKRKKRSCISWQHAASSRKTWPPNAEWVPSHMNGSSTRLRRCPWKTCSPLRIIFTSNLLLIFWVFDWPAVTTQCSTKEREERARENQLAHTGARNLPPVRAVSDTQRERQHPPLPPKKRSESFAARSRAWAQARAVGKVRGPAGAGPAATGGQRWAGPSRGQTCSCGCCCGGQAGNYRGRFYVRRSSGSWCWGETATGSGCCRSCWGLTSALQRSKRREWYSS